MEKRLYFGYALQDQEREIIAARLDAMGRAVDLPRVPGRIEAIRDEWEHFVNTAWDYLPSRPLANRIVGWFLVFLLGLAAGYAWRVLQG